MSSICRRPSPISLSSCIRSAYAQWECQIDSFATDMGRRTLYGHSLRSELPVANTHCVRDLQIPHLSSRAENLKLAPWSKPAY